MHNAVLNKVWWDYLFEMAVKYENKQDELFLHYQATTNGTKRCKDNSLSICLLVQL